MRDHDPRPIPENSPVYDGRNGEEIVAWAHQTLDHYEIPHRYLGSVANESNLHLRNPYVAPNEQVSIELGQSFTFSEASGRLEPARPQPEILARDHPQTVAEAQMVQAAQRKLGVSVPEPGQDFVNRRAAVAFDAPTVIPTRMGAGSALQQAMDDHPSGKYAGITSLDAKTVAHHPPRIH